MKRRSAAATSLLLIASLLGSACSKGGGQTSQTGEPVCDDIAAVLDEVSAIRDMAQASAGGLQEQVGSADSTAALARLADLRDSLSQRSQQLRDEGDAQAAAQVESLATQIDMVVQRNTLAGAGSGDSGTDPTVNIEEEARSASAAAGCP